MFVKGITRVSAFVFVSSLMLGTILYKILYKIRKTTNFSKQTDYENLMSKLKNMRWQHVGKVEKLYVYPLMYGRARCVGTCYVKLNGMCVTHLSEFYKDNVLVVYEEKTKFIYSQTFILNGIRVTVLNDWRIKLEARHMKDITLKRDEKDNKAFACWAFNADYIYAVVKCTDCGMQAAKWISRCILGKRSGLRLGSIVEAPSTARTFWDNLCFDKLNKRAKEVNADLNPVLNLLHYNITSMQSFVELGEITQMTTSALRTHIRPNIIVSALPFMRGRWHWIKIGGAIFKCVKPFSGPASPASDVTQIPMGVRLQLITMNYQLCVPGKLATNDNVYISLDEC